jgi:hypothetical protein
MTQAWYQGGVSLFDFTDSSHPQEIAYFDRGPVSAASLVLGGMWSGYWYNGFVYGSEIARGFDAFGLTPTAALSENEIAAASEPKFAQFNAQLQPRITWAPSYALVRAYRDQVLRTGTVDAGTQAQIDKFIDRAEKFSQEGKTSAAQAQLHALANQLTAPQYATLQSALRALSDAQAPWKPKHVPAKASAKKASFQSLPPQEADEPAAAEPAGPPAE